MIAIGAAGCHARAGGVRGAIDAAVEAAPDAEERRTVDARAADRPAEGGRDAALALDAAPAGADATPAGADSAAADAAPAGADGASARRCNGAAQLCDRRFDQVVFPAAHNAMSNSDDGWVPADQVHNMKRQLEDGIRALLIDTYSFLGKSRLCHGSCLIGARDLVPALREIADFLRAHPDEVLSLLIEDYLSPADTEAAFRESGLLALVYTHEAGRGWPTLREMLDSGRRVFVAAEHMGPPPAWYHQLWALAWDTPYAFKTQADFSCKLNRGQAGNDLFLLNHWLENPFADAGLSATANTRDVLLGRARQCQKESGRLPTFVAVNHYSIGDLFAVVRELNGL